MYSGLEGQVWLQIARICQGCGLLFAGPGPVLMIPRLGLTFRQHEQDVCIQVTENLTFCALNYLGYRSRFL